eukprot:289586-Pleurochrysis_carterae.AAC.2
MDPVAEVQHVEKHLAVRIIDKTVPKERERSDCEGKAQGVQICAVRDHGNDRGQYEEEVREHGRFRPFNVRIPCNWGSALRVLTNFLMCT